MPWNRSARAASRVLVVRLDSAGDVILSGPAVRALAADSDNVTYLAGPRGRAVATLLPGVDDVLVFPAPWITGQPLSLAATHALVRRIGEMHFDLAVIFTSYHQSALPTALLLREARIPRIAAVSEDFPGSLLDIRLPFDPNRHEVERMLELALAAGGSLPPGDDGLLRIATERMSGNELTDPYVVLHPGTSASARAWPPARWRELVALLAARGHRIVVTGDIRDRGLTRTIAGHHALDLGGRTSWAQLGDVVARATAMVVANTGPAHLAAAVGTPVVSLFAPTVPAHQWAPYGVPVVLLGDQGAACSGSRATECPLADHPCLGQVRPRDVLAGLAQVTEASAA